MAAHSEDGARTKVGAADRERHARAASAVIFRGSDVLLVQRRSLRAEGLWSVPGGRVEPGETAQEAARREVREETGLEAQIVGWLAAHRAETATGVFVIDVFFGTVPDGAAPRAGSDAADARFFPPDGLDGLALTAGLEPLIRRAWARLRGSDMAGSG